MSQRVATDAPMKLSPCAPLSKIHLATFQSILLHSSMDQTVDKNSKKISIRNMGRGDVPNPYNL